MWRQHIQCLACSAAFFRVLLTVLQRKGPSWQKVFSCQTHGLGTDALGVSLRWADLPRNEGVSQPSSPRVTSAESSMQSLQCSVWDKHLPLCSLTAAQLTAHTSPGTLPFYSQWCCFEPLFKAFLNSEALLVLGTQCRNEVFWFTWIPSQRQGTWLTQWSDIFVQLSFWGKSSHYGACLTYLNCLSLPCTREIR